jgi:hypothetical protein
VWISDRTSLELTIGLERALIHQRFLADGEVIVNLGQDRLPVELAVSVPLW